MEPHPSIVDLDWEFINGRCSEEEYQRRLDALIEAEESKKISETYYKQQLTLLNKEETNG